MFLAGLFGAKVAVETVVLVGAAATAAVGVAAVALVQNRDNMRDVRHCDYLLFDDSEEDGLLRDEAIKRMKDTKAKGDETKSEHDVATTYNLGMVDNYRNMLYRHRRFSKGTDGEKGAVEADHIPPLQSLREAPNQPGYNVLRHVNPMLHNMIERARLDARGADQLTVQVPRECHRNALSTGRGAESRECRLLIARRIARGEVKILLKQCFIIAHPFASQQVREDAVSSRREVPAGRIRLSRDGVMCIYEAAFLELIEKWVLMGILDQKEGEELMDYVHNDGYLDRNSAEYREIVDIVKRFRNRLQ